MESAVERYGTEYGVSFEGACRKLVMWLFRKVGRITTNTSRTFHTFQTTALPLLAASTMGSMAGNSFLCVLVLPRYIVMISRRKRDPEALS